MASIANNQVSPERFATRLREYETALLNLRKIVALLCRWGGTDQRQLVGQILARLADAHGENNGLVVWLGLRWYSIVLLMYTGGIASLSAGDYASLATVLTTEVRKSRSGAGTQTAIVPTVEAMVDSVGTDTYKLLPGHERNYVPRSEYLFKVTQPLLEDLLFLGSSYERLFDEFEVLFALVFAAHNYDQHGRAWGPPGRFAWKYSSDRNSNPFTAVLSKAQRMKESWEPLRAGLFAGSFGHFETVATEYKKLLDGLTWF